MSGEQKIRAFLFYLSVLVFFVALPFILSFALGYKFDPRTFKFTKTGIIAIKSEPAGADIYLQDKLLDEKTTTSITELLPGQYNVRVELVKHYPWQGEVSVRAGQVTRIENIILFPLRPLIKQLNKAKISLFWADFVNHRLYYVDRQDNIIYTSDLGGERFEMTGVLPQDSAQLKGWKVSADREKLICFNPREVLIIPLSAGTDKSPIILEHPNSRVLDIFWHADSYHFILVTDKKIEVCEAKEKAVAVALVTLNKKNTPAFYDPDNDALYFLDSQAGSDGKLYDNVYKLELGRQNYSIQELIKPPSNNEQ
ncbi:MAG: PEGA domain-containing protein [Candidatus Omnitrophota bacterium]